MTADLDWDAVRRALQGAGATLQVVVHRSDAPGALDAKTDELARRLVQAGNGKVRLVEGDGTGLPARPAISLATERRAPIHYLGPPMGREGPPFVEALSRLAELASPDVGLPQQIGAWSMRLAELAEPARLMLFVAPGCPHCPEAVRIANRLALASPRVSATIIDAQRFESLAERYHVQSVPRILIDEQLTLTTVVPADELVGHLLSRGTDEYAARAFRSLVESGRLADATSQLATAGGPLLLAQAWLQSTTASRMGLLLAVEQVLENDRSALDGAVEPLLPGLRAADAALQGDTADLLGRIGDDRAAEAIAKLLDHTNPDVVEIAEEALEQIRERQQQAAPAPRS